MAINKKATAEVEVTGADEAARNFVKVGDAGKKAGKELSDAFSNVGRVLEDFGRAAVDAVVDVKKLDPTVMVRTFEDYARAVARTSNATGQNVDALRQKYQNLSRANAVLPQQIDTWARSVGRLTYDVKGAQDAFTGAHNAALAFGESDQEQVPFAVYLKNVKNEAGDTTAAIGKLFAMAEKLSTVGGPRALRDSFAQMGAQVDRIISRKGFARTDVEGLQALIAQDTSPAASRRIMGSILGFWGSRTLDIQRTLGHRILDDEGKIKDLPGGLLELYDLNRKSVAQGGRGLSPERQWLALLSDYDPEAGAWLFNALKSGKLRQLAGLRSLGASTTPLAAGSSYRQSRFGRIDSKRVGIFETEMGIAEPLFDAEAALAPTVAQHPILAAVAAFAAKHGIKKAIAKFGASKVAQVFGRAVGAVAGRAVGLGGMLITENNSERQELSEAPLEELVAGRARAAASGAAPPLESYGKRAGEIAAAEDFARKAGLNPATASLEQLRGVFTDAVKEALKSTVVKTESVSSPAETTEQDKDRGSRN